MNPLFTYLIPLFLIACMLFAVVMSGKVSHIISYAGAMLIVVAVAHGALRSQIAVQGMSYMESFYIVIYPLIVAVTVSVLLREAKVKFPILEFRDNLITKLLYWPIIFGVNFVIVFLFIGLR